jgi:aarF domain-containing kinase
LSYRRIPPYFALIIRAIGVLEGIALVGDPEFALVDEAYPYIAKRLLTDESPRLQVSVRLLLAAYCCCFPLHMICNACELV